MTTLLVTKTIHYLCLIALLYASAMKNYLLSAPSLNHETILRVRRFDKLSGAAAGIILLSGLAMLLWLAKPTSYYLSQPFFILKITTFVVASVLIVFTKISFKQALDSSDDVWRAPLGIKMILALDFAGLVFMATFGYLVAHF